MAKIEGFADIERLAIKMCLRMREATEIQNHAVTSDGFRAVITVLQPRTFGVAYGEMEKNEDESAKEA